MKIVYNLKNVNRKMINIVGGKAANLGELINIGINVPKGFVISKTLDEEEIFNYFESLDLNKVAVRSSAICEDNACNSFAGQFETILNVRKENLIKNIEKCIDSAKDLSVLSYANERKVEKEYIKIAVIVQEMIEGEISGVMFSKNPINNKNDIVIEFINGLCESLVQGEKIPSQLIISRDNKIKYSRGNLLDENLIIALKEIAINIEEFFKCAQDIEWTVKKGEIYILQSRPITV